MGASLALPQEARVTRPAFLPDEELPEEGTEERAAFRRRQLAEVRRTLDG